MRFTHYPLGHIDRGSIVEVTLSGNAANVRLLNSSNFSNFKNGRRYQGFGGLARKSPVRLQVPSSGTWHLVIDLQGLRGQVRSGVRVIPPAAMRPLSPIEDAPLSSVPSLVRPQPDNTLPGTEAEGTQTHDVFISHASEDKDEVVRPLAEALRAGGLDVWYDEFALRIGDSLRRKIDQGLSNSRFGVVVLSQAFFGKGWPEYELDGLVSRSVSGEQVLLPIWHNVSKREVMQYSSSLADKLARSTATHTVEEIAGEIIEVIKDQS